MYFCKISDILIQWGVLGIFFYTGIGIIKTEFATSSWFFDRIFDGVIQVSKINPPDPVSSPPHCGSCTCVRNRGNGAFTKSESKVHFFYFKKSYISACHCEIRNSAINFDTIWVSKVIAFDVLRSISGKIFIPNSSTDVPIKFFLKKEQCFRFLCKEVNEKS